MKYHLFDETKKAHLGPTWTFVQTCIKYDLLNYLIDNINTGQFMQMLKWKRLVNNTVKQAEIKRWKLSSSFYSSMDLLSKNITCFQISQWWKHAFLSPNRIHKVRELLRILLNVHVLNTCKYKHLDGVDGKSPRCRQCNTEALESTIHALFECPATLEFRHSQCSPWATITPSPPP